MGKAPIYFSSFLNPSPAPQICRVIPGDLMLLVGIVAFIFTLSSSSYITFKFYGMQWKDKAVFLDSYFFDGSIVLSSIEALFSAWAVLSPIASFTIRRGRQLVDGKYAIIELTSHLRRLLKGQREGAQLHPSLPFLSRDIMTKGLLLLGGIGSGKTQIVWWLLNEVVSVHRTIIFDLKGDFTSKVKKPILLAAWDTRSWIWNVAKDVRTRADAQLFSEITIKESSDPMWAQASRQVLTAIICELQKTKPSIWTFRDVTNFFPTPIPNGEEEIMNVVNTLADLIRRNVPEAFATAENLSSKTGASILITLTSYLSPIFDLATAWPTSKKGKMFSFSSYLSPTLKYKSVRPVIIQGSGKHKQLMQAFAWASIGIAVSKIADPSYSESRKRQIYFVLDEFPQLGQLDPLIQAVEVGRSKGLCMVYGMQDLAQLSKVYDDETTQILASTCTTHIYSRLNTGESAEQISKNIGEQELKFVNTSKQNEGQSVCQQMQTIKQRVVSPDDIATLQTGSKGNEALISIGGIKNRIKKKI